MTILAIVAYCLAPSLTFVLGAVLGARKHP